MLIFVDSSLSGLLTFQLVTSALRLGLNTSAGDPFGWRNSERQGVLASAPLRARHSHHLWRCGRKLVIVACYLPGCFSLCWFGLDGYCSVSNPAGCGILIEDFFEILVETTRQGEGEGQLK